RAGSGAWAQEAAMILRARRRALGVWRHSAVPPHPYRALRLTRTRRIRRLPRAAVLLIVLRLTPLAPAVGRRWRRLVPAARLTMAGLMLRGGPAGIVLLPGLLLLFSAPLVPAPPGRPAPGRTAPGVRRWRVNWRAVPPRLS